MAALLSWNEITARANRFARTWSGEKRERAEAQSFWNDFFDIFGVSRRRFITFESHVERHAGRKGWGRIDAFWPGNILIEHKSRGEDLDAAYRQATDYFAGIPERDLPKLILVCDFERFRVHNLDTDEQFDFTLSELPRKVQLFGFIAGYQTVRRRDEVPANRKAAELMGTLHDVLEDAGYTGHPLEVLLVRIMFCLFAEDTNIFEHGMFQEFLETRTSVDGSDLGARLTQLFQTLHTDVPNRQKTLDDTLKAFPYVNGGLFREILPMPDFNRQMRETLLDACGFNWAEISPAIFGAMFQSIMRPNERRDLGAHYTSEVSILRVIGPLFLDELWDEFRRLRTLRVGKVQRLERFHERLAQITLLDPACGCGNFLVVAYRELRNLETEVLKELLNAGQAVLDVSLWVRVSVEQMIGIELEEWPARIAETALWLTDHQANRRLLEIGQVFVRLPLTQSAHITVANALDLDWHDAVPAGAQITYILGNPPFRGKRYQTVAQKAEMSRIFGAINGASVLDYVAAWYKKSAEFIEGTAIQCAFVSTNSIVQGEQVEPFWNSLAMHGMHRNFAHRTFKWASEGRGVAAVHVIIIGFGAVERAGKFVVDYADIAGEGHVVPCQNINAYLVPDGADVMVKSRRRPWPGVRRIAYGSMANDDGNLIMSADERRALELSSVEGAQFVRRYVKEFKGSEEFINGIERYCLWLTDTPPAELRALPEVLDRIERNALYRADSNRATTRELALTPAKFAEIRQPNSRYLFIPGVSSENRRYIPMDFQDPDVIVSDLARSVEGADLYDFGVLSSAMHMAWVRNVGGRLKSDYRYSCSLVYNTFVWPENPSPGARGNVISAAEAVLAARRRYTQETFDGLYHAVAMPTDLAEAHHALDVAVDRCYRRERFSNELDRIRYLLDAYRLMRVNEEAENNRRRPRPRNPGEGRA
ncbi:class I SAM-dependent DNA methyltransferase [Rhizobium sp. WL3]|uniref:DNA methyltransferase n=1 Tax=Rhizobium sp. WL3 TaxID=2603277 RepID=UPI0011C1FB8B|nr:DNA methyltransferase [Rhizobium sp. WL3]QEE44299.1 class I SAM-dependent DNA methyltransferase [Rhizobium sp. WL3]